MAKQIGADSGKAVTSEELRNLPIVRTDITALTARWKEVLGVDLAVIHDAPPSIGQAMWLASSVLEAIREYDLLLQWSRRALDGAFIHRAAKSQPIALTANAIHFYEPDAEFDPEFVRQFFEIFACNVLSDGPAAANTQHDELAHNNRRLIRDANGDYWIGSEKGDDHRLDERDDDQIHRGKVLEGFNGLVDDVTCVIRQVGLRSQDDIAWDDNQNQRRCDLIDKQIDGTISDEEQFELLSLHARLRQHLDKIAPVPLEGARKLHAQLLEKKRKQERQE